MLMFLTERPSMLPDILGHIAFLAVSFRVGRFLIRGNYVAVQQAM